MIWRFDQTRTNLWFVGRQSGSSGFTLIEVLVALAIMVLVVAIVVPLSWRNQQNAQAAASARQIVDALRLTRERAILDNRPADFVMDIRKDMYRAAGAASPAILPGNLKVSLSTTDDLVINDSAGVIRFFPDGSSSGGGVTLIGTDDRYIVAVDWLTGGISIHGQHEAKHR